MIMQDIINFNELKKTDILNDFVVTHNGCWNHDEWLKLCEQIESAGYSPIDFTRVGAQLEILKAQLANNIIT
jgi:hypothetical protein